MYLKNTIYILIIIFLIAGSACQKESITEPKPKPKNEYLGEVPPGLTPKIFSPDFICLSNNNEYTLSFSPDGNEVYFYRIATDWYCKIYFSKIVDGNWTEPKELPISAGYTAMQPHITSDNKMLYFSWNEGMAANPNGIKGGIYLSERSVGGEWGEPKYAGLGMYLTSSKEGQLYTTDISEMFTKDKTYLAKVIVENGIFKGYERLDIKTKLGKQAHPCIAPDESYILFDVEGGSHLFVSFKNIDGTWAEAIDLVYYGFDVNAGAAYISPDGDYLFYHLNNDIYWVSADIIKNLAPEPDISFSDIDGNTYKAKKIGNKFWMTENFKAIKDPNGQNLQEVFNYNNDTSNTIDFGRLYTWQEAVKATPTGWHIPTQEEWEELINSLGGANVAGGKLKETGIVHWNSPNRGATNASGFNAIASGFRGPDGIYYDIGNHGSYWGIANNGQDPYCVYLYNTSANVVMEVSPDDKTSGIAFAVRYIKN